MCHKPCKDKSDTTGILYLFFGGTKGPTIKRVPVNPCVDSYKTLVGVHSSHRM